MKNSRITAEVISCPGELGNDTFAALQLNLEGFRSPYALTLALRAIGYKALAEQADPAAVLKALAAAVNTSCVAVEVRTPGCRNSVAKGERPHA